MAASINAVNPIPAKSPVKFNGSLTSRGSTRAGLTAHVRRISHQYEAEVDRANLRIT